MAFRRSDRQRIVDDYLRQSGQNLFKADEFIDWLADKPDHEAFDWFYGIADDDAAREYRISLARRMVSGLRIVVSETIKEESSVVHVISREYPAMVSPMAGRSQGGGYYHMNNEDPAHQAELRHQGAMALRTWLMRYRGCYEAAGVDLAPIEKIAASVDVGVVVAAE